MGYPLIPGYESVGRVVQAGRASGFSGGETVFVPGARCFGEIRGLFGGSASRLVVSGEKAVPVSDALGEKAVLLALAATAYHSVSGGGRRDPIVPPDLIVGHGVLGRLLARMTVLAGGQPTVWERDAQRAQGAIGYTVLDPQADARRDYRSIYDVSGDCAVLDTLIARMAPGGELVLAGFYSDARSADPRGCRMEAGRHAGGQATGRGRHAVARRTHHPPRDGQRGRARLPHRLQRRQLPEDGARLEKRKWTLTRHGSRSCGCSSRPRRRSIRPRSRRRR
jgi:threonine dehydrogenase-like Zn-dependent dehydrogenase